jgi:hypothetical protein
MSSLVIASAEPIMSTSNRFERAEDVGVEVEDKELWLACAMPVDTVGRRGKQVAGASA